MNRVVGQEMGLMVGSAGREGVQNCRWRSVDERGSARLRLGGGA